MAFYGDIADSRRLAYNVLTADFPDVEIQEYMEIWSRWIEMKTHSTWDSGDEIFPIIGYFVEIMAAIDLIRHYGGPEGFQYATALKTTADELWNSILEESTEIDVDTDELEIARTEFKTYPKNPDAMIPRGRLSKTGFHGQDSYATVYKSKYID